MGIKATTVTGDRRTTMGKGRGEATTWPTMKREKRAKRAEAEKNMVARRRK